MAPSSPASEVLRSEDYFHTIEANLLSGSAYGRWSFNTWPRRFNPVLIYEGGYYRWDKGIAPASEETLRKILDNFHLSPEKFLRMYSRGR